MRIKKERYPGEFSSSYIERQFVSPNEKVLYTRCRDGWFAIIVLKEDENIDNIITYENETKVPLWKQSMDMSMGKLPHQTISHNVSTQVRWLGEKEVNPMQRYSVYRKVY